MKYFSCPENITYQFPWMPVSSNMNEGEKILSVPKPSLDVRDVH